jgi:hypothetical protein
VNRLIRTNLAAGSLVVLIGLTLVFFILLTPKIWDFSTMGEKPLAPDFAIYWSASYLALAGEPAAAYDINKLQAVQDRFFRVRHLPTNGWYYPPTFLLMALPLALLPYLPSLAVWLGTTLCGYVAMLSRTSSSRLIVPLSLTFSGAYENFLFGQNGYLSGFLLGGGLILLDKFPLAAGLLLGMMCYKPHLLSLSLVALAVGRHWRAVAGILASASALALLSLAVFGLETWLAYIKVMSVPLRLLEDGLAPWSKMPTFFAAVLSADFSVSLAYAVQGVVMLLALAGVAWVWARRGPIALRGSVLILGILLFSPYAFIYDLALLAFPLAWLWEEGRLNGRLPGETFLLFAGWLIPLATPFLWEEINLVQGKLQAAPLVLLSLFAFALWRHGLQVKNQAPLPLNRLNS